MASYEYVYGKDIVYVVYAYCSMPRMCVCVYGPVPTNLQPLPQLRPQQHAAHEDHEAPQKVQHDVRAPDNEIRVVSRRRFCRVHARVTCLGVCFMFTCEGCRCTKARAISRSCEKMRMLRFHNLCMGACKMCMRANHKKKRTQMHPAAQV